MILKLYQSFLNDAAQIYMATVTSDDPTTATSTGLFSRFTLGYKDYEPCMIIQFLLNETDVIDLSPPAGASSWTLTSALGFKTSLKALVSAETDRIKTSMDLRYNENCILAIDSEKMYVTSVVHDAHLGLSYLTVERRDNKVAHYPETSVRVVRSSPTVTILNLTDGKIKISWDSTDTDAPGDYDLEVTMSRIEGTRNVRWSILPLLVTVTQDYNLE